MFTSSLTPSMNTNFVSSDPSVRSACPRSPTLVMSCWVTTSPWIPRRPRQWWTGDGHARCGCRGGSSTSPATFAASNKGSTPLLHHLHDSSPMMASHGQIQWMPHSKSSRVRSLRWPDFSHSFVVECDAFGSGMGAILHQGQGTVVFFSRPIAPISLGPFIHRLDGPLQLQVSPRSTPIYDSTTQVD